MEAGGGLMTVLGAIISAHKNKWWYEWYEWKSFATILSCSYGTRSEARLSFYLFIESYELLII